MSKKAITTSGFDERFEWLFGLLVSMLSILAVYQTFNSSMGNIYVRASGILEFGVFAVYVFLGLISVTAFFKVLRESKYQIEGDANNYVISATYVVLNTLALLAFVTYLSTIEPTDWAMSYLKIIFMGPGIASVVVSVVGVVCMKRYVRSSGFVLIPSVIWFSLLSAWSVLTFFLFANPEEAYKVMIGFSYI